MFDLGGRAMANEVHIRDLNNEKPSVEEFSERVWLPRAHLGYLILRTGQLI